MNSHQPQPQPQQQLLHHHHHHHHRQHQIQANDPVAQLVGSGLISPTHSNQAPIQQQHQQSQPQQKNQILPLLLSPSLIPNSNEQIEQVEVEPSLDQVINLENEFSDTSNMLSNIEGNAGPPLGGHLQQHSGDIDTGRRSSCLADNQLSSSSEDLLNLLLELDHEPSGLIGFDCDNQIDQDERAGIENIRKQLMSCEVQSEQQQPASGSMSPIIGQMAYQPPQQPPTSQQNQTSIHQQPATVVTQQLITQTAPVISHHQQQQMSTSNQTHHQQLPADQPIMYGLYSTNSMSTVPVSSSGQPYTPQQQHVARISQASNAPTMSNSPSPSWQQPQLSYSPQNQHNNSRSQSQRPIQHHHTIHPQKHSVPHQTATSPQMQQQLHSTLTSSSTSQPVSPSTTEPSPVVKKNPLLNAQLVNSRGPTISQGRFMSSPTNVLNQNPILNAKLSQSPFLGTSPDGSVIGSPVSRGFVQPHRQSPNFDFNVSPQQQHQPQNAQQHLVVYGPGDQQNTQQLQSNLPIFGSPTTPNISTIGNTGINECSSQQVKQDIQRKVQPKQLQTTSLLKQLLSDDN